MNIRNDDKCYYLACPDENCRRKVNQEANQYHCETCKKSYDTCVPTYMLSVEIADASDSVHVNFYREMGEKILGGLTASKFLEFRTKEAHGEVKKYLFENQFCHYTLLLRNKFFGLNKQLSLATTRITDHSLKQENLELLKRLEAYRNMETT
mmetsp:Transcript_24613/g.24204  ORF Transcript_24613/g.24204 Transcript_24613/m.24204 type:complete len:152 (+) Transcript_24613:1579-2034(+)